MNERLLNVVTNKLIVERDILEGELEDIINGKKNLNFKEQADTALTLIKKIAKVFTALNLWESYNKEIKNKTNGDSK